MRPLTLLLACMILLVSACSPVNSRCSDPLGCMRIGQGELLTIGVIFATQGEFSTQGVEDLELARAAEEEIVLGHYVNLIEESSDCSEKSILIAATSQVQEADLLAVVGPACPGSTSILEGVLGDAGIPFILPIPDVKSAIMVLLRGIEQAARLQNDHNLIIPFTALQQALETKP